MGNREETVMERVWKRDQVLFCQAKEALSNGDWETVVDTMLEADHESNLRKTAFLELFQKAVERKGAFYPWLRMYVTKLYNANVALTEDEALFLAKISIQENNFTLLSQGIAQRNIEASYTLGRKFDQSTEPKHLMMAYEIYCEGSIFEKILELSLKLENYRIALEVIIRTYELVELPQLLRNVLKKFSKRVFSSLCTLLVQY
jgi:hypothetical protein